MRILTALCLFALPFAALADEKGMVCNNCEISGYLKDSSQTRFTVQVQDAVYSLAQSKDVTNWLGVGPGTTPNRVTCQLILRINGVNVFFPYKAYANLGNPIIPNGISVTSDSDGIYLYIRGGEGAGAYVAKFIVINGKLARCEVVPADSQDASPIISIYDK